MNRTIKAKSMFVGRNCNSEGNFALGAEYCEKEGAFCLVVDFLGNGLFFKKEAFFENHRVVNTYLSIKY